MTRRGATFLSLVALLGAPSSSSAQMTVDWALGGLGDVDGVAAGDVDGDGRAELAVVINGSSFNIATTGGDPWAQPGKVILVDGSGHLRWSVGPGRNVHGIPAMADLDGDGTAEIVMCEAAALGDCFALDGNGAVLWRRGPFYFPSLWTTGPSVADLDRDGDVEVVFATWGGQIVALDGRTGTPAWSYDAWAAHGELFYSHVAVGQLDQDAALEVTAFGYRHGMIVAVDGAAGAMQAVSPWLHELTGHYAYGTGPVIADIDQDGANEIVTSAYGPTSAVYVFEPDGTPRWYRAVAQSVFWSSPVVGDSDGDGATEIHVQGAGGALEILSATGAHVWSYQAGSQSWFQPLLLGPTSGGPSSAVFFGGFGVLEAARTPTDPFAIYQDPASYFWLGAQADLDDDGLLEVVATDPIQGSVVSLSLALPTACETCDGTCSPYCPAGQHCSFCGAPSSNTTAVCEQDSSCDLWCTDARSCGVDCDGADCNEVCLQTQRECTAACHDDADCQLSCTDPGRSCYVSSCEGSSCDVACTDSNQECRVDDCTDSTCGVTCDGASHDCRIAQCTDSTCAVSCSGSVDHSCTIQACTGSSCSVECTGDVTACGLACGTGSQCMIACGPDVGACQLSCPRRERVVECGAGVKVCSGTPCP